MPRKRKRLVDEVDAFAMRLLVKAADAKVEPSAESAGETESDETPGVVSGLREQALVLATVTRWVQVKHKIEPESEKPRDFATRARERLRNSRASSGTSKRGNSDANGSAFEDGTAAERDALATVTDEIDADAEGDELA